MGWSAANFDEDEACSLLLQLISTSSAFNFLNIRLQCGSRKVRVEICYAAEDQSTQGNIKIGTRTGTWPNFSIGEVICEAPTMKTEKENKI